MGRAHEITRKGGFMAIETTAQTISLTCDRCQVIQDRMPTTPGIWEAIEQAGWLLNRQEGTCVCPDCLFAESPAAEEVSNSE